MIKHIGHVKNGTLRLTNHDIFKAELERLEGKDIEVTVKKAFKKRSLSQNNYYWGVVIPMIQQGLKEYWGEVVNTDDTHNMLKVHFSSTIKVSSKGSVVRIPTGTSDLSTEEFNQYFEKCIEFGLEMFGIRIPLPNENLIR